MTRSKSTAAVAPLLPASASASASAATSAAPLSSSAAAQTTIIDGVCYDITEFMHTHPGGAELLLLAVGRDASVLFHSYHRRLATARSALQSLPTVPLESVAAPSPLFGCKDVVKPLLPSTSSSTPHELLESPLYTEIREGVNAYFRSLPRGADGKEASSRGGMLLKSAALLFFTAAFYYAVVVQGYWYFTPLLGVLFAMNGLAIQHDANHGAFSRSRIVNQLAGFVDDLIGGSGLMWRHQHVLSHHAYPNDMHWDADTFSNYPLLRLNPALPARWWFVQTTLKNTPEHCGHLPLSCG
jgi:fatty acid desaturase (delta-4 desaturase)